MPCRITLFLDSFPKNYILLSLVTSCPMSTLFSCFFFTLLSLNPHSAHLYIIESPISFSGSMSPPQHAHFMTSKCHRDEILFLSLVFLAYGGIYISLMLFLLLFGWDLVYRNAVSNYTFRLYIIII